MRDKTLAQLRLMIDELVTPLLDARLRAVWERIDSAKDSVLSAVDKIEPAKVDLTQEMADDIVRKIHGPLTINKEFSDWLAEQGKFHDLFYVFPIGYGSDAGRGEIRATANGTMMLEIRDCNGASLWRGSFVPPDFGKSK